MEGGENLTDITEQIEKILLSCCKLSRETWTTQSNNSRNCSPFKWQSLLTEITNVEFAIEEIRSIRKKLFQHMTVLDTKSADIILKILKGIEVELEDGIANPITNRLLGLFSEAKKAQNEQSLDVGNGAGDRTPTHSNTSLPNVLEKQFTLRLSGNTETKGMGGPQFMR